MDSTTTPVEAPTNPNKRHFGIFNALYDRGYVGSLPATDLRVLWALLRHAKDGTTFVGADSMGERLGINRRNVQRALASLAAAGICNAGHPRGGRGNFDRTITVPETPAQCAALCTSETPAQTSTKPRRKNTETPAQTRTKPRRSAPDEQSEQSEQTNNSAVDAVGVSLKEEEDQGVLCELQVIGVRRSMALKLVAEPHIARLPPLNIRRAYLEAVKSGANNPVGVVISRLNDGGLDLPPLGPEEVARLANGRHITACDGVPITERLTWNPGGGVYQGGKRMARADELWKVRYDLGSSLPAPQRIQDN